jgi:hypothetical protein
MSFEEWAVCAIVVLGLIICGMAGVIAALAAMLWCPP